MRQRRTIPKPCTRCGERLEHVSQNGECRSWCSPCLNTSNEKTKAKNPEKYFGLRRGLHLRKKYGLTLEDYDAMLAAQGGGCAICGAEAPEHKSHAVDHDAISGRLRGILCENCNRAIGQLGHDPERIRAAADYLDRARIVA